MNFNFIEINKDYIEEHYPHLLENNTRYFAIAKNRNFVGIYAIINRKNNICEVFLTIFEEFRFKVFNRDFFKLIFNYPFKFGYKEIWSSTTWDSWKKIFKRFKSEDIEYDVKTPQWELEDRKRMWFKKRVK